MSDTNKIRLRKPDDEEIYGPMDMAELKHLANTAYISPDDEVALDGVTWCPAPECEELEMVWSIQSRDGTTYGPTTVGTIKEFYIAGEIGAGDRLIHSKGHEGKSIRDVLGEEGLKEAEAEKLRGQGTQADEGLAESMEIAKDLRIRNLEVELDQLKKESDELKQKYLKVCDEIVNLKKEK